MQKKTAFLAGMGIALLMGRSQGVIAQLSLTGQLRTRTEYRDGYGIPESIGSHAAFFTSQRTRLTFNYHSPKVIFQASLQDVRVWGADASTISSADGNRLGIHEAWAEIILANSRDSSFPRSVLQYLSVRIGRQEIVYDDQRLLGNLDWLQQGRRHDAIVIRLLQHGWQADLGAAFNQNTDAFNYNGTFYTPANVPPYAKDSKGNLAPVPAGLIPLANTAGISAKNGAPLLVNPPGTNGQNQDYKAMQFLYVAKVYRATRIAGLLFADEFGKYITDSVRNIAGVDTGYIYGRRFNQPGLRVRVTSGLLLTSSLDPKKAWNLQAGWWYQGGRDRDGLNLAAYMSTLSLSCHTGSFTYTAGWDYNHRFDPLYGTPHKFWGYMDYFYAGTGSPTGGLNNPFLKWKYASSGGRFTLGVDYHYFSLAAAQKDGKGDAIPKYLGSEIDAVAGYQLNKITALEGGACWLAASHSMEYAKGLAPGTARLNATWAYLQVNIRPDFFSK